MSSPASLWNSAPLFWKTYALAVLFVGGIIAVGELSEGWWEALLGVEQMESGDWELLIWIVDALVPTAVGCLFLSRLFTGTVSRLTESTIRLAAGDMGVRMSERDCLRGDEIGALSRGFNLMAERLSRQIEGERRLLGDISHELRSPLTRMSMALALARRQDGAGNVLPYLDRADLEVERMSELIGLLLAQARDAVKESRVSIDVAGLVRDVAEDAAFEGASEGVRVETRISSAPLIVSGHGQLLRRAVENVVRNALRYAPPQSVITLEAFADCTGGQREAVISVRDQGPGVPDEALALLFRPFYRVDKARTRDSGGVGLGLSLVEQAVRGHGGTVQARNVSGDVAEEGTGETATGLIVTLRLPLENRHV